MPTKLPNENASGGWAWRCHNCGCLWRPILDSLDLWMLFSSTEKPCDKCYARCHRKTKDDSLLEEVIADLKICFSPKPEARCHQTKSHLFHPRSSCHTCRGDVQRLATWFENLEAAEDRLRKFVQEKP